jgi:cytochrome b
MFAPGTDLVWPPLGEWFTGWVAATGVDPTTVSPLAPNTMDQMAYQPRAFRRPVVTVHLYAFDLHSGVILMHVVAVVLTEVREGGSIAAAMFTGGKILNRLPEDA